MEYIDGYSITNRERLKRDKISLNEIALNLSKLFNKMIF